MKRKKRSIFTNPADASKNLLLIETEKLLQHVFYNMMKMKTLNLYNF